MILFLILKMIIFSIIRSEHKSLTALVERNAIRVIKKRILRIIIALHYQEMILIFAQKFRLINQKFQFIQS